jgi:hypothetical protein
MFPIGRQISRTLFELAYTVPGKLERALLPAYLLVSQTQPAANEFRFRAAGRFPQIFQNRSIFHGDTGMNVCFHAHSVAHDAAAVLQIVNEPQGLYLMPIYTPGCARYARLHPELLSDSPSGPLIRRFTTVNEHGTNRFLASHGLSSALGFPQVRQTLSGQLQATKVKGTS